MLHRVGHVGVIRPAWAGQILVGSDFLSDRLSLTRTQASDASSTALDSDNITRQEYAANIARFNGTARRLFIEGSRTNLNSNPRFNGGTPGTPGTLPTGINTRPTGAPTTEFVGTTAVNGVTYGLFRFAGVPTTTGGQAWALFASDVVVAGTAVTNSVSVYLHAGTLTNVANFDLRVAAAEGGATTFTPTATPQRINNTRTTTGTVSNTTLRWNYVNTSDAVDFTLAIGLPQREHAPFASSPILPVAGTPATSTRGADLVSATLASLGIGENGACTVIGTAMLPQNAATGLPQTILHIDDCSVTNRYYFQNTAGGAAVQFFATAGGVVVGSGTTGSMTAGTAFRWGVSIDGTGRIATSLNGATAVVATGGVTSGLTTLRLGTNANGTGNLFGEVGAARVLPHGVSNSELQRLVANLPL